MRSRSPILASPGLTTSSTKVLTRRRISSNSGESVKSMAMRAKLTCVEAPTSRESRSGEAMSEVQRLEPPDHRGVPSKRRQGRRSVQGRTAAATPFDRRQVRPGADQPDDVPARRRQPRRFASKAGAPTNPDWYHNLVANPRATIEVGDRRIDVIAKVAEDATASVSGRNRRSCIRASPTTRRRPHARSPSSCSSRSSDTRLRRQLNRQRPTCRKPSRPARPARATRSPRSGRPW